MLCDFLRRQAQTSPYPMGIWLPPAFPLSNGFLALSSEILRFFLGSSSGPLHTFPHTMSAFIQHSICRDSAAKDEGPGGFFQLTVTARGHSLSQTSWLGG